VARVLECQWQATDRLKLHSSEAAVAGVLQRVFAHPARYAPPCSVARSHIAGHVRTTIELIGA
jgi:hypothetical protein